MAAAKQPTLLLAQLIQSYARAQKLDRGQQLHAHLLVHGGIPSAFVANHFINMYVKCGDLHHALALFDGMPHRNLVSWSAMVAGFSQNEKFLEAIRTFSAMHSAGIKPSEFALSSAIQASASSGWLGFGRQMHCLSLKLGFCAELFVGSNLADMYSKCGSLTNACQVFEEMPCKDEVSWTAMIDGYSKNGNFGQALLSFKEVLDGDKITVDQHVLCSALNACGGLKAYNFGRSLHSRVLKMGFQLDIIVANALVDVYAKNSDMESASRVVKMDPNGWNVVSCSSLIDGYVEMDCIEEALKIYVESRRKGIEPNEFTFSSMIKACACQAVLEQGIQLHAQVIKTSFLLDPFVSSSLVDMYGKCGLVNCSVQVFHEIQHPSESAWNSLISVLAQHGHGQEAVQAFERMVWTGIKPNHITFVSLLMACSHSGLVELGLDYFFSMNDRFGIEPSEDHFSCVIDLLSRAGRLKEAKSFISQMPFEPNAYGWCSLLGACRIRGDKELGEIAAEKLMELEPGNSGMHVLLSSIYAAVGQWDDVRAVRKLMKDNNVKKLPGFSWVDVNNKTHVFGAEDWSHPKHKDIFEKLDKLTKEIKEAGYVPAVDGLSFNVENSLKETMLKHHSERIAIAFALISLPATKPIIVKKNLRVCVDCHSAIKFISKVEGRVIILRDSARFHHFADGLCSCGDYW